MIISGFAIPVAEFMSQALYTAADVQRDFKWEERQVTELLDDLQRASNVSEDASGDDTAVADADLVDGEEAMAIASTLAHVSEGAAPAYVLGTVVTSMPEKAHRLHIYDGLQRMTSLTILIEAVMARLQEGASGADTVGLVRDLRACLKNRNGTRRLTASGWGDWIDYEKLLQGGEIEEGSRKIDVIDALKAAARVIRSRVTSWDDAGAAQFARYLLGKVYIVVLDIADKSVARQVFVTTNYRGKPLNSAEIFKGQIADIAGADATGSKVLKLWDEIRIKTPDVLNFVNTLAYIECRTTDTSLASLDLSDALRQSVEAADEDARPQLMYDWLKQTDKRADAWRIVETNRKVPGEKNYERAIFKLGLLEDLEWRAVAVELLVRFLDRVEQTPAQEGIAARNVTSQLEALWRRLLAFKLADTGERARFAALSSILDGMAKGEAGSISRFRIYDNHIKRVDRTLSFGPPVMSPNRVLLKCLEASRAGDLGSLDHLVEDNEDDPLTPEHLLPKKARANSTYGRDFPNPRERNQMKNWPANFVLLPKSVNQKLDRLSFEDKQAILREDAEAMQFSLVHDILEIDGWNPETLTKRAEAMTAEAWELMGLTPPAPYRRN